MLEALKEEVCAANLLLPRHHLVISTWGNVSGIDEKQNLMVIKPSGVSYETMRPQDMCVIELSSGKTVEGRYRPSSDTPTHLELYQKFGALSAKRNPKRFPGGIVHTHSRWATVFSQSGRCIPPLGTTHADYFYGTIPCTRPMTEKEIGENYEQETGKVIVETFRSQSLDPLVIPAALVYGHGPFAWGNSPMQAVEHAMVLEEIAMMAWHTLLLHPEQPPLAQSILDKHYFRKHGCHAYYGQ